ncbi:unnamed protein product [Soboliphyme baturini]|uniref:DUF2012 domain-containing protein n=1 Tax=Soboliphyme baturini TaxID=241478 RepID=A0A183IRW7_9BILA|nr:unnamed protein product [Soboliphyme baturini]
MMHCLLFIAFLSAFYGIGTEQDVGRSDAFETDANHDKLFRIEGRVIFPPEPSFSESSRRLNCRVLVNYGQLVAFVRQNGSFTVRNVPSGSYVVEVASTEYMFDQFRVDITSKGKIRARRVDYLQPSLVSIVPYPLKFVPLHPMKYFRSREQWRITDFLFSPMVLMMIMSLVIILLLPKLANVSDPDIQREMQQSLQMPKYDLPELSEVMANWFGGGGAGTSKKTAKKKPGKLKK